MRYLFLIFLFPVCNDLYSQELKMYPCRTPSNIGVRMADRRSGDTLTIDVFLKATEIKAEAGKFTILSYKITMDGAGFEFEPWEIENIGEKFTENTIAYFRKLRPGAYITFDCITAKDSYGYITGLKPALYLVR